MKCLPGRTLWVLLAWFVTLPVVPTALLASCLRPGRGCAAPRLLIPSPSGSNTPIYRHPGAGRGPLAVAAHHSPSLRAAAPTHGFPLSRE
jgi:hypothetical protein